LAGGIPLLDIHMNSSIVLIHLDRRRTPAAIRHAAIKMVTSQPARAVLKKTFISLHFAAVLISILQCCGPLALGQRTVTEPLAKDEIGVVNTSPGFCTRISFPDDVAEVFCGDLYDPTAGKGSFVLQSSGRDVFLKPLAMSGMSSLFVKIGKNRTIVYNFELKIVPAQEVNLIVKVVDASQPDRLNDTVEIKSEPNHLIPTPPQLPLIQPLLVEDPANLLTTTRERVVTRPVLDSGSPLSVPPFPDANSKGNGVRSASGKPR